MTLKSLDGFEIFPWNKNFETGIPSIDSQHKQLVLLLNQLGFYLGHMAEPIELSEVFDELATYADYHFKAEEDTWEALFKDDPWFVSHQQTHASFSLDVTRLRREEGVRSFDGTIEDILRFLSRWLVLHILDSDMRMAKAAHCIKRGLSLKQAKVQADNEMKGAMATLIETILQMYDSLAIRTLALMRERAADKQL